MDLKPLSLSDFSKVYAIEQKAHDYPWTENAMHQTMTANYDFYGLEVENNLVGFVVLKRVLDEIEILNLCVHSEHQRKGVGSRILQDILVEAKQSHVKKIFLELRVSNQKALGLYQKLGFVIIDTRKSYYPLPNGQREDATCMCFSCS